MPTRGQSAAIGAALLALVLLVTTLLDGWARVEPEGPQAVEPGEYVEAAPFRVRLDDASAAYEFAGRTADKRRAFVVVTGELSLEDDESVLSGTLVDAFVADLERSYDVFGEATDEPEAEVLVATDGSALIGLGPGLTYEVALLWQVDEDAVPTDLTVTLDEHTWRASALDGDLGWFDPAPTARVDLAVAPLPAERPKDGGF